METHVPGELSRHLLTQARLTGSKVDKHYEVRFQVGAKVGSAWIHERIMAILLFPEPLTVHVPCKTCGRVHEVRAQAEMLTILGKVGSLCPSCYKEQERARDLTC